MVDWNLIHQLMSNPNRDKHPAMEGSFEQQLLNDVNRVAYEGLGDAGPTVQGLRSAIAGLYLEWMDDLYNTIKFQGDTSTWNEYYRSGERGSIQRFLDKERHYLTHSNDMMGEFVVR